MFLWMLLTPVLRLPHGTCWGGVSLAALEVMADGMYLLVPAMALALRSAPCTSWRSRDLIHAAFLVVMCLSNIVSK